MVDVDQLLDLTEHRCLAGYVLALTTLGRLGPGLRLGLLLRDLREARWLAARLNGLGYRVQAPRPRERGALVTVQPRP